MEGTGPKAAEAERREMPRKSTDGSLGRKGHFKLERGRKGKNRSKQSSEGEKRRRAQRTGEARWQGDEKRGRAAGDKARSRRTTQGEPQGPSRSPESVLDPGLPASGPGRSMAPAPSFLPGHCLLLTPVSPHH